MDKKQEIMKYFKIEPGDMECFKVEPGDISVGLTMIYFVINKEKLYAAYRDTNISEFQTNYAIAEPTHKVIK